MGELVEAAKALADVREAEDWERAVEALMLKMATVVEQGVMLQADYTRKTQELAHQRKMMALHVQHQPFSENRGAECLG